MPNRKTDHDLITKAMRFLDTERERQPSLTDVAAHLEVSTDLLQHTFSSWTGVSPKCCLQYLTLDFARQQIANQQSTQATTFEVGLASPGRLSDLFIKWEAITPNEYKSQGAGLTIHYGWFDSPFGDVLGLCTERGLYGLAFATESPRDHVLVNMTSRWPNARFQESEPEVEPFICAVFGDHSDIKLLLYGTPFQIKVWKALIRIPSGAVTTYAGVAEALSRSKAHTKAIGSAIGSNPISWIIPCHRVLASGGALGGYSWGPDTKRAMLAWERARTEAGV